MLTLTETLDAIRAIDTDTDIVRQACERYLGKNASSLTVQEAAEEILVNYRKSFSTPALLLDLLTTTLAVAAATSAKRGHEPQVCSGVMEEFSSKYITVVKNIIQKEIQDDPKAGLDSLLAMMEALNISRPSR